MKESRSIEGLHMIGIYMLSIPTKAIMLASALSKEKKWEAYLHMETM